MPEKRYKVLLHASVSKELKTLPAGIRQKAKSIIDQFSVNPVPVGASRLRGRTNAYRIRVGDYRIVYEVHATEIVVYVVGVSHRREIYRRILRRK